MASPLYERTVETIILISYTRSCVLFAINFTLLLFSNTYRSLIASCIV